jgi:hypothetical protein
MGFTKLRTAKTSQWLWSFAAKPSYKPSAWSVEESSLDLRVSNNIIKYL